MAKHPADRRRDIAGRQRGRGHLIQQRLEQVVIVAVDERDADRRTRERARGVQAAETAAEDDDVLHRQNADRTGACLLMPARGSVRVPLGGPASVVESACPLDCPDACSLVGHRPARQGRRRSTARTAIPSPTASSARRCGSSASASTDRTACSTRPSARAARATGGSSACRGTKRSSWSPSGCAPRRPRRAARRSCRTRTADRTACSRRTTSTRRCGGASAPRGWRARSARRRPAPPTWRSTARCRRSPTRTIPRPALIVLWGVNPSASGIHLVPYVREAQKRGAKLVVVDPRTTPLARSADVHLAVRPGTDVAVALAIHRYLFEQRVRRRGVPAPSTRAAPTGCANAPSRGRSSRPRRSPASTPALLERAAELYADELAGAHPLRLGTRAQPQRRQRRDGGARAAGGRRQVRRARRRLLDEQLRVVEHRAAVDRRAGARHARRQHEPSRPGAHRLRRSAGRRAVRLQLQSRGDGARPAPRPARPRARRSLHGRLRAGDDRHGALRRRRPAGDDVPRRATTSRRRTARSTSSSAGRSSTRSARRARTPTCSASCAARLGVARRRRARRASWTCWCACSTRCPARSATICARAVAPAPPFGDSADPVRGRVSRTRPIGRSISFRQRSTQTAPAGPVSLPARSGDRALSARAHLAGERSHHQLDARRAAAPGRQADDAPGRCGSARAGGRRSACASSTSSAKCTARSTCSPTVRPGTVSLPKGLWRRSTRNGVTGTALVPDTLTDLGGGACFNDARVQVRVVGQSGRSESAAVEAAR